MRHTAFVQLLVLTFAATALAEGLPIRPLDGASTQLVPAPPLALPTPIKFENPGSAAQPSEPRVAFTSTITPTSTPTTIPTPMVTVDLVALNAAVSSLGPQAPGPPSGSFVLLTASGKVPQTLVRLRWRAAEPGSHMVKGYRLYRATAPGFWVERAANPAGALWNSGSLDAADLGQSYQYVAVGLDSLGRMGAFSEPGTVDLTKVENAQLAPPPPQFLSAVSRRDHVLLAWPKPDGWFSEPAAYNVYQGLSAPSRNAEPLTQVTAVLYAAKPPTEGKDYLYALAVVDSAGRVSDWSLTVTGRATGTIAPSAPQGLTTRSRTEKVALEWQPSQEGTAVLASYELERREESVEAFSPVASIGTSVTAYTDSAPGDRGYIYRLRAVDVEGNSGPAAYVGASPSAKVWNKTAVLVMPTAYANKKKGDAGINQNVLFDFYVGSLFESYTNPITNIGKSGVFQPLQVATVTSDTKWALLDDRGLIPGLATGLYISALINFGQPSGGQTVGVSSAGGGVSTLGNAYAVLSKRFWPGEPRAAVHGGIFYGKLADYLTSDPMPASWRPTLRHLTPGSDYPFLFSRFIDPKLAAVVAQAPHMAFAGLQFPFTVPLYFTRWKTGLRLEAMVPLAWEAEYPRGMVVPSNSPPAQDSLPWLLNIHLDNLPLFGFEFGVLQYQGGYQVLAFYHIPDLSWAW